LELVVLLAILTDSNDDHGLLIPEEKILRTTGNQADPDPFRSSGNPFGQSYGPTPLTFVHTQHDTGVGWWMVNARVEQEKIRTELTHGKRSSVDQQANAHIG
jgi:hypothetical protein